MAALSKEELLKEKETIDHQLKTLTGKNQQAEYKDMGSSEEDNAHEVEQYEIDTSLVGELQTRLTEINKQLEETKE